MHLLKEREKVRSQLTLRGYSLGKLIYLIDG